MTANSTSESSDTQAPSTDEAAPEQTNDRRSAGTGTAGGRKILIGSQRDAADPSLKSGRKATLSELHPERIEQALKRPEADTSKPAAESTPGSVTEAAAVSTAESTQASVPAPVAPAPAASAPAASAPAASAPAASAPVAPPRTGSRAEQSIEMSPDALATDDDLEAALEGLEMDSLLGDAHTGEEIPLDSRVKGVVTRVHNDNVFFSLKSHWQGVASLRQFRTPPAEGAMLEVVVNAFREDDGLYDVSIPGAAVSVADWADLTEGAVVDVRVSGSNTGGLECVVHNIRGFIPASQIAIGHVDHFGDFVNQKFACVVTEVNPRRKRLVLSRRAVLEREAQEKKQSMLESLQVGETLDGVVTRLMDFGAFVDIGGVEGLVHVSKLSWERVNHPREVLESGQRIRVKIEKISPGSGKIGLSLRDTQENPWTRIDQKYPVGAVVDGAVSRLAQFGAFVRLESGVEGLIHISELAHHRVVAVKNVVNVGDAVSVKVLSVDPAAQKIGLSLKATQAKPEAPAPREEEPAEPVRDLAVKRRDEPLKGGRGRNSGGEKFGLNW